MEPDLKFEKIISEIAEKNFSVIDGFFDEDILEGLQIELLKKVKDQNLKAAGIGNKIHNSKNVTIRSDKIEWINNLSEHEAEKQFLKQVGNFCSYMNRTCYVGITNFEFHYAFFEKGTFYRKHLDRFKNDDKRKFSMITYLNKNWKDEYGGVLKLYFPKKEIEITPQWGRTVIFKSDLIEHEVLENTKERLSITGWLK
jgi:SM-20-related protein